MTPGLAITIAGVAHRYHSGRRHVDALSEVSLRIGAAEFVALLGPSGCGKTTLLQIIGGLLAPTRGTVTIADTPVRQPYTDVGIVFQDPTLLEWRTALRNILLQAEVRHIDKASARDRAMTLMKAARLAGFENAYPAELSGGMKQRVALCRALLHDPPLLLMDEPFGALDALTREQMAIDLQALWLKDPKTIVFVTHSITEAVFLADRVVVFSPRPGRILEVFTVDLPRPRRIGDAERPDFRRQTASITELLRSQGILQE